MKKNIFNQFLALEQGEISHTLAHQRDDAIMVVAVVPGERWEIEFFDDGSVEAERFVSNGEIYGESALSELLVKYSDQEHAGMESPQDVGLTVAAEYEMVEQA